MSLSIAYLPLSELRTWKKNPKMHDMRLIQKSVDRFGFVQPILVDETTEILVAGHGRLGTLEKMKGEGQDPPARIEVNDDGEWLVPVIQGVDFEDEDERDAYALTDNRSVEAGGWDEDLLTEVVSALAEGGPEKLDGTGFTTEEAVSSSGVLDLDGLDAEVVEEKIRPMQQVHVLISIPTSKWHTISEKVREIGETEDTEVVQSGN